MNKVILLGRLTKDPDIRYSQSNNLMVAKFNLAVNRSYVKQGEERQTDFISIVAYSKLAEFVEKYLKKGIQICLCGRIQTRVWTDDNNQRHYITEVIADEINFADSVKKSDGADINVLCGDGNNQDNQMEETITPDDDDLPF